MITPEWAYINRRKFVQGLLVAGWSQWAGAADALKFMSNPGFKLDNVTPENLALSYNNFYEFSLDKDGVKGNVDKFKIEPWSVEVSGLCEKPRKWSVAELSDLFKLEERVYRFRCVEAWSMVLPWTGFELRKLVEHSKPKKSARFVKFTTFADKSMMPNVGKLDYPWPYTEGLTIEESMNSLALMAVGLYGKPLAKQNGAPIRLVVPWKYGFKSIKSVVRIEFVDKQPSTLWNYLASNEYGFYANVNPTVDHPRWSQASEKIIDGKLFSKRQPTLMFNGYEKEVAGLYKGLDLTKNY